MADKKKSKSIWDMKIVRRALWDSLVKLDPRNMMKNPVMFVVEVGSLATSILLVRDVLRHQGAFSFNLQITLWLWFTVLFANFAEAMAEGRGKAQADSLRKPERRRLPIVCCPMARSNRSPVPNCVRATW
jgi:potassium-transporting ATPase ATP-binding subunit